MAPSTSDTTATTSGGNLQRRRRRTGEDGSTAPLSNDRRRRRRLAEERQRTTAPSIILDDDNDDQDDVLESIWKQSLGEYLSTSASRRSSRGWMIVDDNQQQQQQQQRRASNGKGSRLGLGLGLGDDNDDDRRTAYPTFPNQDPRLPRGDDGGIGDGLPQPPVGDDVLLPLLILLTSLLFSLLIFLVFLLLLRRRRGQIALPLGEGGPTNLEHEERWERDVDVAGIESRWLEQVEEPVKIGYTRAKVWQTQYPPNSQPTDITLSQFLSIQEKGVSAWSFEPDYESNPALIVQSRTEITFLSDGVGMAPEEGGGCNVQSNLPLPKINEVYYWECKMFEKPEGTNVAIGLATKPYPSFRMPGWNKYSVGYFSADGFKSHSYPFTSTSYGPPLKEGDVLGVGYRPRSGTVFFTRNGKKLEDAYVGLNRHNLFPTVGADGPATVHVNLGQAGFVFIEANVKKWGLAPMMGTLAPPPAYGSERGSILLESAAQASRQLLSGFATPSHGGNGGRRSHRHSRRRAVIDQRNENHPPTAMGAAAALGSPTQPTRPSPLRHSRQNSSTLTHRSSTNSVNSNSPRHGEGSGSNDEVDDDDIQNPPTPGLLDISLHSMHRFPNSTLDEEEEDDEVSPTRSQSGSSASDNESSSSGPVERRQQRLLIPSVATNGGGPDPPAYHPIDPNVYAPGVAEAILEDAFSGLRNPASANLASAGMFHPSQHQRRPHPIASTSVGGYEADHLARSPRDAAAGGAQGILNWLGFGAIRGNARDDLENGRNVSNVPSLAGPNAPANNDQSIYPGGGRRGAPGSTR